MNHKLKKSHFLICLLPVVVWAGSISVPSKASTINSAMLLVKKGDTVWVEEGTYREHVYVAPGVHLLSKAVFKAVIDGNGKGTVVTLANGSSISGFDVRNGTIGIFTTASGVNISQCRVIYHQQTGIMCVGNLPKIEDNLVIFNKGSGIQGWDVRTTSASINHNTIAFNSNHGVSIGGNSSIILENNIVANNDQFGIKPAEESVRIEMKGNNFYQNAKFSSVLPSENYSVDPLFVNAQTLNFSLNKESRCVGRGTDSQDIGARINY